MPDIDTYPTVTALGAGDRLIVRQTDGDGSKHTRIATLSQVKQAMPIANQLTAVAGGQSLALPVPGPIAVFTSIPPGGGTVLTAAPGQEQRIFNRCRTGQTLEVFPILGMAIESDTVNAPATIADGDDAAFLNNGTYFLAS
jgi:hypothetical protein